jgi:16S rRNA A1518/A1519 N6-dimethyltransferase RsmA/KsgA/DIM1 with predicted DNA glycosylase/AP lyase activity
MFSSRRKTLRNTLMTADWAKKLGREKIMEILAAHSIDPGSRGESLSPEKIVELAKSVQSSFDMV